MITDEQVNIMKQIIKYAAGIIVAGIFCAVLISIGTYGAPENVQAAANTTTTTSSAVSAKNSLEMKTTGTTINLNAGQSFDLTFSASAETSGFGGYLNYDTSVFTSVTIVAGGGGGTSSNQKNDFSGEWKATYDGTTHFLSVKYYKKDAAGNTTSQIGDPVKLNGSTVATLKFTSAKPVIKTDISFQPSFFWTNGTSSLEKQSITLTNSEAKTITLAPGIMNGNGHISVPVYVSQNDGFSKLKLGVTYNRNVLSFESFTFPAETQSVLTQTDNSLSSWSGYVSAEFTAAADVKTTGTLMYANFQMANGSYSSYYGTTTDVVFAIESVEDQAGDIFSYNSVTSSVTLSDRQHTLGDISGDGQINLIDVLYVMQYYNQARTLTDAEKTAADVNRDGKVDLIDAYRIMQYYNGVIQTFY